MSENRYSDGTKIFPMREERSAKHTSGPWSIEKHGKAGRLLEGPGFISPALIGNIFDHRSGSADRVPQEETQTANARLIAAAPELLEAGKAILAKESELATRHAWSEYRALEAAIAKAEGRASASGRDTP